MSTLDYSLVLNVMLISIEGAEDVGYTNPPPLDLRLDSNPLIGILISPSASFPAEFYSKLPEPPAQLILTGGSALSAPLQVKRSTAQSSATGGYLGYHA